MKFTLTIFAGLLCMAASAQTNFGFGLPITVTPQGNGYNCTVTDPVTGSSTHTISSATSYLNSDGVLIWKSNSSVGYVTYDVDLHTWKTGSNGATSATIYNDTRIVAYATPGGSVFHATYDPVLKTWKTASNGTLNQATVQVEDGVVSYFTPGGSVYYATYDAVTESWKSGSSSFLDPPVMINKHGVVAFASPGGSVLTAVYDPGIQAWKTNSNSFLTQPQLYNSHGVVVAHTNSSMQMLVYDPDLQVWKTNSASSVNGFTNVSLNEGTVSYTTSNSYTYGYNKGTTTWQSNYSTQPYCKLFISHNSGPLAHITFLRCLSFGAGQFDYDCDDGQTISRIQGWKRYTTAGTYNVDLTVSNSQLQHHCNGSVTAVATGIEEADFSTLNVFPNPASETISISGFTALTGNLTIYNISGQIVRTEFIGNAGTFTTDISTLDPGFYMVRLSSGDTEMYKRFVKI